MKTDSQEPVFLYKDMKQPYRPFTIKCKNCGSLKKTRHKDQECCSYICSGKLREYLKKDSICETCGTVFKKAGTRKAGRFCSQSCYWKYMKGNTSGDKCNAWDGGKRSIDYLERRRFQREIQKLVFERDDYSCQICGQRGGYLQVDHIQPWAEYVELRFDMKNCRTLCQKCHYKVTYGRDMPQEIKEWGHNFVRIKEKNHGL